MSHDSFDRPLNETVNPGRPLMPAETVAHQTTFEEDRPILTENAPSPQDVDLVYAVCLLRSGHLTERQLGRLTRDWTAFGPVRLKEHLLSNHAICPEEAGRVDGLVEEEFRRIAEESLDASALTFTQVARRRFDTMDPTGKIAKLLGIADMSVLPREESVYRSLGARYTLLRKIGQGGLGVVWLARDENLQRYVAIKELRCQAIDGDVAIQHFRREAEITGRLEHPGIVPIYQFGGDEQTGQYFYVMRFLGKRTLSDAVAEFHEKREAVGDDSLLMHRLLTAFVNVCQTVGHAHSRSVVHRDLKPENIAVDEFGQVTILDWGLSKIDDETGMYDVRGQSEPGDLHGAGATRLGRVLGTPLYMAPEQASGRLDEVDALSDVYGLGGILYYILTGVAPHQSLVDAVAASESGFSDLLSRIVVGDIPSPRALRSDVPPDLDAICVKALARRRYLRYESALELASDVQRHIAGAPVSAHRASWGHRLKRWMAAHPTLTQATLLLVSLIVIGGAAIGYTVRESNAALQRARYTSVEEFSRELEASMRFKIQSMTRDLQFVSDLPLMDSVTRTQIAEREQPDGKQTAPLSIPEQTEHYRSVSDDSEAWLARQGELFRGLLAANPAYLVMATCVLEDDGGIRELVRAERMEARGRVLGVPKNRLTTTHDVSDDVMTAEEASEQLAALRPGVVMLMTNNHVGENVPVGSRSPLAMSGVCAIDDAEGNLFGFNVIELDLRERLEEIFLAVAPERVNVCVTDSEGNIVATYQNRHFSSDVESVAIAERFPQLKSFFAPDATALEYGDGRTLHARRVQLGLSPKSQIGIVTHLFEE